MWYAIKRGNDPLRKLQTELEALKRWELQAGLEHVFLSKKPGKIIEIIEIIENHRSMDWFKGKPIGNHRFSHEDHGVFL